MEMERKKVEHMRKRAVNELESESQSSSDEEEELDLPSNR